MARKAEDEDMQPFYQLQKSQVLHEAKAFNDSPLDSRKCCSVLTELLCLLSQGETLSKEECTTLFFSVTKLFQSQDPNLRRLVYLIIKELNQNQDEAFIVISSLEKDINGGIDLFRANAMRVHSKVIDASMLEQRARLFRQAIVNPNEHIASTALTAGIRMFGSNPEVIRRWVNEVRETTNSNKKMVSFHGLHLLYKIHESDKRAVMRLVTSMINKPPDSAYARCLLIRYAFSCLGNDPPKQLLNFIKDSIKQYKSPMVMFEAAKALCHVPNVAQSDLALAVTVMQEFLNSPRIVQRFASVRALSAIVSKHPNLLTASCTVDLEHLITDPNRNIATLAITTLLNTTAEYSIERLLNSITDFMTEIADELKIVLIDAIRNVCIKYPKKYEPLLAFLAMALREEGGYFYKNRIVDCMLILMNSLDRAKEFGLDNLCEFIEDCEYPSLSVRILNLIGDLGAKTATPSRYIRFIFNRVLLELPCVRAAAVTCLTTFAVECPYLRNDIRILLQRSLIDEDDEVRDRATAFTELLNNFVPASSLTDKPDLEDSAVTTAVVGSDIELDENDPDSDKKAEAKDLNSKQKDLVPPPDLVGMIKVRSFDFEIEDLEITLTNYLQENHDMAYNEEADGTTDESEQKSFTRPFDTAKIYENKEARLAGVAATALKTQFEKQRKGDGRAAAAGASKVKDLYGTGGGIEDSSNEEYLAFLRAHKKDIPELGEEIVRSDAKLLTEPEAEYQVELIKHVYSKHIVLQYNIQSLMEGQILNDIYVDLQDLDNEFFNVSCGVLNYNDVGIALTIIDREFDGDNRQILFEGEYPATLIFITKDATENAEFEEGYEDRYVLQDIEFTFIDWMMNVKDKKSRKFLKTSEVKGVRMGDIKRKWPEFNPERRNMEIEKQGYISAKKNDNMSYRDAIEWIMGKTRLQSLSELFDIDEDQDRLGWTLYNCTIDDTEYIMRVVLEKEKASVHYKMKLRPCDNQFSKAIKDAL